MYPFPYKGLRSMANLWVKVDEEMMDKFKAFDIVVRWFQNKSVHLKFEVLTDDDGSLHIYTKVK